jgi:hypothetical protein
MSDNGENRIELLGESKRGRLTQSVTMIGLIGVCVAAFWTGSLTRKGSLQNNSGLVISDQYLDFGEVWETKSFPWTLIIKNESSEDREIEAINTSCACLKVEPYSLMVPAGQTAQCKLTLDLTKSQRQRYKDAVRPFQVRIIPHIRNTALLAKGWTIQGQVRQAFVITPSSIDFGDTLIRGKQFLSQVVSVQSKVPIRQCQTRISNEALAYVHTNQTTTQLLQITIAPKRELPSGFFDFVVEIEALDESGNRLSGAIPVKGRVLDTILVTPHEALLGARLLGQTVEETVTIQSRNAETLTLCGTDTSLEAVEIKKMGKTIDTDQLVLSLKVQIAKRGEQRGLVRIRIQRRGAAKQEEVILPIVYHGLLAGEQ